MRCIRVSFNNLGSTFIIVFLVATGIALLGSVVGVVNALVIRELPVKRPNELIMTDAQSYPLYEMIDQSAEGLSSVMAVGRPVMRSLRLEGASVPIDSVLTEEVSGNFFSELGVSAFLGRTINVDDDRTQNNTPVVMISHRLWKTMFLGESSVLGKHIYISNRVYAIVGVAKPHFNGIRLTPNIDVWIPLSQSEFLDVSQPWAPALESEAGWLSIVGRTKKGVTNIQVETELNFLLKSSLSEKYGETEAEKRLRKKAIKVFDGSRGDNYVWKVLQPKLKMLLGLAIGALVAVCVTLSSLLLVKAISRKSELALRSALGARSERLVMQVVGENSIPFVLGAGLGLIGTMIGTELLAGHLVSGEIDVRLDLWIVALLVSVTALIFVICSTLPTWWMMRGNLFRSMKESSRSTSLGGRRGLAFKCLVWGQLAISFVTLSLSFMFVASLKRLAFEDLGYEPNDLVAVTVRPSGMKNAAQQLGAYNEIVDELESLSFIERTTFGAAGLYERIRYELPYDVPGYAPGPDEVMKVKPMIVGTEFFDILGIRIVQGRAFSKFDYAIEQGKSEENERVVISDSFSNKIFPDVNPIGRQFSLAGRNVEVVGVVEDARTKKIDEEKGAEVYLSHNINPERWKYYMTFFVRIGDGYDQYGKAIREVFGKVDPTMEIQRIELMTDRINKITKYERMTATVASVLASMSILLAGVGLYAILTHIARSQMKEVGIRLSLGANANRMGLLMIRRGLSLSIVGCGVGLVLFIFASRLVVLTLYQVEPFAVEFAIIPFVLLSVVALVSSLFPALKCSRIDPVVALRL